MRLDLSHMLLELPSFKGSQSVAFISTFIFKVNILSFLISLISAMTQKEAKNDTEETAIGTLNLQDRKKSNYIHQ